MSIEDMLFQLEDIASHYLFSFAIEWVVGDAWKVSFNSERRKTSCDNFHVLDEAVSWLFREVRTVYE